MFTIVICKLFPHDIVLHNKLLLQELRSVSGIQELSILFLAFPSGVARLFLCLSQDGKLVFNFVTQLKFSAVTLVEEQTDVPAMYVWHLQECIWSLFPC